MEPLSSLLTLRVDFYIAFYLVIISIAWLLSCTYVVKTGHLLSQDAPRLLLRYEIIILLHMVFEIATTVRGLGS